MITVEVNREDFSAAGLVAANVTIQRVYLAKVELLNEILPEVSETEEVNISGKLTHRFMGHELHGNTLLARIGARVDYSAEPKGKKSPKLLAVIDVVYGVEYRLPDEAIPVEVQAGLNAFARINGLYNCWPYLRDEIQRLSAGISCPVTLPVLRIIPRSQEQKGAEEEILPRLKGKRAKRKRVKKTKKK